MGALTPSFFFDLESRMRLISSQEFQRLLAELWAPKIMKTMPSGSRKERLIWLLDTASIERAEDGQVEFEDIVSRTVEYEVEFATKGLLLKKSQLEDLDGNGVALAAHWSRQMGAQSAYWPQKVLSAAIRDNPEAYDGEAFFSLEHPVNPFNTGAGTFANLFTGAVDGIYPGALPIDAATVTVDEAVQNIAKALAYVASLKMPNGEDPRKLKLGSLFVPPALVSRAQQITNAKFIAQAAGDAAGSADVEAIVRNWGLGQPVMCEELGSAFGGSDTSYYLGMQNMTSDELGAWLYIDREPFAVTYHGPQTDADLARKREFQWTIAGRNTVQPGHPYLMFRADAT